MLTTSRTPCQLPRSAGAACPGSPARGGALFGGGRSAVHRRCRCRAARLRPVSSVAGERDGSQMAQTGHARSRLPDDATGCTLSGRRGGSVSAESAAPLPNINDFMQQCARCEAARRSHAVPSRLTGQMHTNGEWRAGAGAYTHRTVRGERGGHGEEPGATSDPAGAARRVKEMPPLAPWGYCGAGEGETGSGR